MKKEILSSLLLSLLCLLLCSGLYSLAVLGVAQLAPGSGKGQTVCQDGRVYYSNLAQRFTADRYFWSRPSAVSYNAAGSGGSNKGPSNPGYLQQVSADIAAFQAHNPGVARAAIPSELVTASGSGLDPDISWAGAAVQVARIAQQRNMDPQQLYTLIRKHTRQPLWGIFGPAKINVLSLNLALDQLH